MKVIQYIDTERPSNPYIQLIKSKSLVSLGEYDSALTIINNVKEFDSYTKCHSEVIKSNICRKQGKLDQALKLSMGIVSEINELPNNMELLSLNYSNIGSIYSGYGDLNNALDYHLKALKLNEEIGKELDIARSLNLIGIIYYKQGELDNCLEYYKQSMEIFRKIGNRSRQAYSLFDIINTLSITDISKIPEYLAMLEEIDNSSGNKIIHQITRLAQAIYYKTINRMYRKIEAQRLLKEIAKEPIFDF
ncbi:MAG: tetratricopeptide repeat protein, partial [Candidatus Heimdallarchaeota archaeon]|nr:tetratricopeptide repeat protein [Candidatus Heimdallarchaeota archaeon]